MSDEFFVARALGFVGTGAEIDMVGNFGSATDDDDCLSPDARATAKADSFSPTHERVNHRPPAMPLISRLTGRQCRTFAPERSSGKTGANPVLIFCGGWTEKGFMGSGYCGSATSWRFMGGSSPRGPLVNGGSVSGSGVLPSR